MSEETTEQADRFRRILESPSRLPADQDLDLLAREDLRAIRLQLEYVKPDLLLAEAGVKAAIVVFGGSRIPEREAARDAVERAEAECARRPGDPEPARRLAIAERLLGKSHFYDIAREFGRIVGRAGKGPLDSRLVIVTGGGPGLMEAANRGALEVGAETAGLNITLPREQLPNPFITPRLSFQFRYFALRKLHFMLRARALVAFPGGFGTLDELFETLCLIQTGKQDPLPVILVGEAYWRGVFDPDFLVEEGVVDPGDLDLFQYAETAEEIWSGIQGWYEREGKPLFE